MKNILTSLLILFSIHSFAQQADTSTQNKIDSLRVIVGQGGSSKWILNKTLLKYKFPVEGGILSGTTNNGFLGFHPQTIAVITPVDGFKLYDSAGLVILRNDGYRRTLSFAGLTANVKYNFPVGTTNDTVTTNTAPQILTMKSISGLSNYITNIQDAALSSNVDLLNAAKTYSASKAFSTGNSLRLYNTSDQVTNTEFGIMKWLNNAFYVGVDITGTGNTRVASFGTAGTNTSGMNRLLNVQSSMPFFSYSWGGTGITGTAIDLGGSNVLSASSGTQNVAGIFGDIQQTSTAKYRALFISPKETSLGGSPNYLIDAGVNTAGGGAGTHTSKFSVDNSGNTIGGSFTSTTGAFSAATGSALTFTTFSPNSIIFNTNSVKAMQLFPTNNAIIQNGGTYTDDGVNRLQVTGNIKATQFRLSALNTAPTSSTDTGTTGEIRVTSGFIYVCTATNTWVRSALSTW